MESRQAPLLELAGLRAQLRGELSRRLGRRASDEQSIIAADRANDLRQCRLVERDANEVRRPRRRLDHHEVRGDVDRADKIAEHHRALPFVRERIAELSSEPGLNRSYLVEVAGYCCLRD